MATYIVLLNFTEQGVRNIKQTPERAEAFRAEAEKLGASVKEIYWALGAYDGVVILESPDDETAARLLLQTCSLGNVRTQTLRAFNREELSRIIA